MQRLRRLVPLGVVVIAAGCGGGNGNSEGSEQASSGTPIKTITIRETEFKLDPSTVSISKPGTYEFKAVNDGQTTHALEIEGNGVEEETEDISPGSSATLKVELKKSGEYELYCPIGNHKDMGMEGSITLGSGSGSSGTSTTETGETETSDDDSGY